ncbi:sigma-E processing peptidase SpoIIGA [Gemmiger sp. An50]|uniref:sigma-E processing peptidase SpoIIGA n=1 Tax=Gemmiger sp. An50 TaxID=1965639 RepID=UPI0013A5F6AE|nr:sigma-E processing peptidase SpoIIGA [Gemmiger sp. An50]
MKTVIYLDVLLLVNFLVAYLLLRAVGFLCGAPPGFWRTCAGAVMAALSSLILLAPPLPAALSLLYQAASAAAVCRTACPFRGWRGFAHQTVWYFLLNLGLAGAVLLALSRGLPLGAQTNNFAVYWAVSPSLLVGCAVLVYLTLRLVLLVFGGPKETECWQLRLSLDGADGPPLAALLDTGFLLRDPLSGQAPVLASYTSLRGALPEAVAAFLAGFFAGACPEPPPGTPVRLIPCKTASGMRTLPAVGGFSARLSGPGKVRQADRVLVVFTDQTLADGSVQALFGAEFYHTARPVQRRFAQAGRERSAVE